MNSFIRRFFIAISVLCGTLLAQESRANHLFGADFTYTWVSGNTYRITLTAYGDCIGAFTSGSSFQGLQGGTPQVYIYNGASLVDSINLAQVGAGVEVSPVCPSQLSQTSCSVPNSTIQGVKRYTYAKNYTLSGTSANWRFIFNGSMPTTSSSTLFIAGRSTQITNITNPSIMRLEATLNNTVGPNSNPTYTTIPTPFFCVNKPANYNPGTVDPDAGDVLSFALVDGLEALPPTSTGGLVNYIAPYTATAPLPVVAGSFTFSTTNGQLSFTPNLTSKSLVVSRVTETRGSTVVGTSMREMVFVVTACNNNPPAGSISNPSSGATVQGGTAISVCRETGLLTFNINPTDADGDVINVAQSGVPAGATFTITNNNSTAPTGVFSWNVANVTPGVYNFFITYTDQGCPLASKQTLAYTITVLPNPSLTYTLVKPATCNWKAVFNLTPANANSPYTITFGSTTRSNVTGMITDSLSPGTYTFRITATNGCTHDTSITIAPAVMVGVTSAVKKSTCSTLANGSVTLTGSSGTPPYTYAQGTGPYGATNTFSPLAAGTYTFHIKDNQGCVKDTTIVITDSLIINATITTTPVVCYGQTNGIIQVTGSGGVNPYTYALGSGAYGSVSTFTGLTAGTYPVHVKDNLGCIRDVTATVTQPTAVGIAAAVTNVTCNGQTNGSVTLTGSGGVSNYTYAQGAGAYGAAATFSGLAAGTYTFHVRDLNNCQRDTTITITQPAPLAFTFTVTNVLCFGGSMGTVTVNATGGTTPYTYASDSNPFGLSATLTGLNAGTHAIHLKDANGCTKDSSAAITQPPVLAIGSLSKVDPTCNGGSNGTITVAGTGGTTPYTYAVDANPFAASGNITGLTAGTYAVHIKDANGCTKDTTVTLGQPTAISVTARIGRPRCTPLVNGTVVLSASGGVPGYTYARGSGTYVASSTFTGLGSGTYIFHVKDANSCIKDTTITVTDSIFLHATTVITNTSCYNDSNGKIAITPSGGDVPYTYALNTNPYAATNPITNLRANTYVLHVRDSNGCILDTNVTVAQPTIVVPNVTVNQPKCFMGTDGSLVMNTTGGTPSYTYALGSGAYGATPNFPNLDTGIYTVHVRDANGCQRDTTVTMGQPTELRFGFITMTHLICNGDSSGTVIIRANGATPPYTFSVDVRPFQTAGLITGMSAGTHSIHVKDANGCTRDSTILLWEPTKVRALIAKVITPTCEGFKDGTIAIDATGGNPGYTYSDDNAVYDTQKVYTQLPEGPYRFYVKDSRGCVGDTSLNLVGYPHINIASPIITDASCNGYKDGAFTLRVTGGNQPLTYIMKLPADTNKTGRFDSLGKGIYTVRIVDTAGCFKETTVSIDHPDTLIASTTVTPNDCIGFDDGGAVEVNVRGGTTPYGYLWSTTPHQTGSRITGLPNGKYAVIVTDAHNCHDTTLAVVPYDNCCTPVIPDAFTPNGDGRNDHFRVLFKGDMKLENFSVYNRYGQRIFYTTSTTNGWDGTWNDRNQDAGTYFYYIKLICGNRGDNVLEFKGDVTLIR